MFSAFEKDLLFCQRTRLALFTIEDIKLGPHCLDNSTYNSEALMGLRGAIAFTRASEAQGFF